MRPIDLSKYTPTPADIRRETAEIRQRWPKGEAAKRAGLRYRPYVLDAIGDENYLRYSGPRGELCQE